MDFRSASQRVKERLVGLYLNDTRPGEIPWSVASGVLVAFANRFFVFTSGHNLEHLAVRDIFLMFPRELLVVPWKGGQAIREFWRSDDPDVAVIELEPADQAYWNHMSPVELDDFAASTAIAPDSLLLIGGYPCQQTQPGRVDARADPASPPMFASAGLVARVGLAQDARSPHEPSEGRGLHVIYHGDCFFDIDGLHQATLPAPEGLSGGPLLAINERRSLLLGLARAKHSAPDLLEWYEPAFEALRLLVDHADLDVRSAVIGALEKLSPKGPA